MLSYFKLVTAAILTLIAIGFAQDVTLTKNGYYRTWIGMRLPLGEFNKMYNYTIEQAVDAYNLNDESQKAWENLKKKTDDDNSL